MVRRKRTCKKVKKAKVRDNTKRQNLKTKRQYVKRRSEVYGIMIVMLSVLFFISLFSPNKTGIIIKSFDYYLSYVFGLGKYLIPFLVLGWGISFFIKKVSFFPSRIGWGFLLFLVSVLGLLSNNFGYTDIFDDVLIRTRGGIIGAGIYYGLFKLLGKAGTVTVLSVFLIISLLIITKTSIIEASKRISDLLYKIVFKPLGNLVGRIKKTGTNIIEPGERGTADKIGYIGSAGGKQDEIGGEHIKKESITELSQSTGYIDHKVVKGEKETRYAPQDKEKTLDRQLEIPLIGSEEEDQDYKFPPISLLKNSRNISPRLYKQNIRENVNILNRLFNDFNLAAKVNKVIRGPAVTLYELTLSPGVKVQRLLSLEDDFCVAMGSPDLRILTPIPGKSAIGIEVPNKIKSIVTLGDIYSNEDKNITDNLLCVPLGKNLSGDIVYMDIKKMPHVLIAGATNSGKSSCLNSIITSLLMKVRPSQVKFILIDPKMVELSLYNGIPQLLTPVVIDPKKASSVLSWAVEEMEKRFRILVEYNCKSIEIYNFEVRRNKNKYAELKALPYILIFIDELADLMMVSASEVEDSICRVAQMGRAVGIHLVVSTQRPSVNIITGLIKANIPSRISFMVASNTDSRVILDCAGAEKLIGKGDMLYLPATSTRPERLQGAFVTTKEIEMITSYIKNQKKPEYDLEISEKYSKKDKKTVEEDELLYDALRVVVDFGHASASLLQRRLRIGYSRAARIIDQLEDKGLVGSYDGSKPREVLVSKDDLERILRNVNQLK